MAMICKSVLDAIGNTPLIRLRQASELTGCTILGKAEFMNPGQSVKDRAGKFIIEDAIRRKLLRPGGVVVEGTAGNTGIGLRQFSKDVKIALADPMGAALHSWYTQGELKSEGSSITEGIGQGRITANLEGFRPDFSFQIPDSEAVPILFDLIEHEGLCLGGSSGVNIAGAIRLARELGPGHTIVTILCDHGTRYQSKLFNTDFLRSKELPVPAWLEKTSAIDIPFEKADG